MARHGYVKGTRDQRWYIAPLPHQHDQPVILYMERSGKQTRVTCARGYGEPIEAEVAWFNERIGAQAGVQMVSYSMWDRGGLEAWAEAKLHSARQWAALRRAFERHCQPTKRIAECKARARAQRVDRTRPGEGWHERYHWEFSRLPDVPYETRHTAASIELAGPRPAALLEIHRSGKRRSPWFVEHFNADLGPASRPDWATVPNTTGFIVPPRRGRRLARILLGLPPNAIDAPGWDRFEATWTRIEHPTCDL